MANKNLFKQSLNYFSKSPFNNIVLGVFASILIAGLCCITILFGGLFIILAPIILLPFLFAVINSYIDSVNGKLLTFKSFLNYFSSFFSVMNMTSFRYWKSILFSMLFFIVGYLICSPISFAIVSGQYPMLYQEFIYDIQNNMSEIMKDFEAFYNKYVDIIKGISFISTYIPSLVFALIFTFNLSINSVGVYIRRTNLKLPSIFVDKIYGVFLKENRIKFYIAYLKVNWPYYTLLVGGFVAGYFLALHFDKVEYSVTFSLLTGFIATSLYSSLHFSNLMALTMEYIPSIVESYKASVRSMIQDSLLNPNIPDIDKDKMKQILDDINKDFTADENIADTNSEDNKD